MNLDKQDWSKYTKNLIQKWVYHNNIDAKKISRVIKGFDMGRRDERFAENPLQKPDFYCPDISSKAWHEPQDFNWTKKLEDNFDIIKKTYEKVETSTLKNVHPENKKLADGGVWNSYYFYRSGIRYEQNCEKCPEIMKLIDSIEGTNNAGSVYFARLTPKAKIKPHFGPHNFRIRCHIGIKVPENCFIEVGGIKKTWEVGKCITFDDSFYHFVENNSDKERAVFILDVWNPDLTQEEIKLISFIIEHHIELQKQGVQFENLPNAMVDFN